MTLRLILWAVPLTLFLPGAVAAETPFRVREVQLAVEHRQVASEVLLPEEILEIVSGPRFAAFRSDRGVWIKLKDQPLRPLSKLVELPQGFDWYELLCVAGDQLVIALSQYPEERRRAEDESAIGEFRTGPHAVGYLVVDFHPLRSTFLDRLKITSRPRPEEGSEEDGASPDTLPSETTLGMQSCYWDGKSLYIGDFGSLARVDLKARTVDLLEEDGEVNRMSIFKEGDAIWYAAFFDSPWVEKWEARESRQKRFELLNDYVEADVVLKHEGRLLTSSNAGLVEIDEAKRTYIHYRSTKKREDGYLFGLTPLDGRLWAMRDDGWVELQIAKKRAVYHHLQGQTGTINAIGVFEGVWYVATSTNLVRLK